VRGMTPPRPAALLLLCLLCGCSTLLPKSREVTASPWSTYRDAESAFAKIVPGHTTVEQLKELALDPSVNPNIAILNYADVLRKFLYNQSVGLGDLDDGVRECVTAKILCRGFELNQRSVHRHRNGSFVLDFLGFKRETHIAGWRFHGLILLKGEVVVYKLTSGQPAIQELEAKENPLGPLQSIGQSLIGIGGGD
jgi:hypothetical protein